MRIERLGRQLATEKRTSQGTYCYICGWTGRFGGELWLPAAIGWYRRDEVNGLVDIEGMNQVVGDSKQ